MGNISFTRYVDITSGVGGQGVAQRELIARIFTTSQELATGTVQEFTTASSVGDVFGTSSTEYKRASAYFGWVSKAITSPKKISFARWADADVEPMALGIKSTYSLSSFTGITTGSIRITLGPDTNDITGLDFSLAASLAAVAAVIQSGVNAEAGTMWTAATVTYNSALGRFELAGGDTGNAVIAIADAPSGTTIMDLVGWGAGATLSDGMDEQTITTLLTDSTELSNNFGAFIFVDTLTADEALEAATWNDAQNNRYQFCLAVTSSTASARSAALIGYSGCGMTLDPGTANKYPDQIPATVLASTDYTRPNAAKNYMFQQFPDLDASVSSDTDANTYDGLRVNYIGVTQNAGQQIEFYQRGFLTGGSNDAIDMGVYANEQWLKSALDAALMSMLVALDRIPASIVGESMIKAGMQGTIETAKLNGTFNPGKALTDTQKLYVSSVSGDDTAWFQVQSIGYWLKVVIVPDVNPGEYKAVYTLIYSKGDSVRKVEGSNIMI